MHRTLSWAKGKSPRLGAIIDGTPLVVIENGTLKSEVVRGMKLRREDIEAAARSSNLAGINDIDFAILERNGRIIVFPKTSK